MEVSSLRRHLTDFGSETPKMTANNRRQSADSQHIFDKSEMDQLLSDARTEKLKFETIVRQLRDQLTMAELEVKKLREQLVLTESDSKEEIHRLQTQIMCFELKCNEFRQTNEQLVLKLRFAENKAFDSESRAKSLAEDRTKLMEQLNDKSRLLEELESSRADIQQQMRLLDQKMAAEREEWDQFQTDLLTTVRVAEEFKQETILECQKLRQINKDLETKLADLEVCVGHSDAHQQQVRPLPALIARQSIINFLFERINWSLVMSENSEWKTNKQFISDLFR